MKYQPIKFALPKGRFLSSTAKLLDELCLGFEDYNAKTRQYRLGSTRFAYLSAKVLQEKDIPVQVAIGNYDLGICGLDWIEELQTKYPTSALTRVSSLGYGEGSIHMAASNETGIPSLDQLPRQGEYRIVTEYPNLAESLALNLRLRRFKIFPVWGAAEVYPPENADIAILWQKNGGELGVHGLVSLAQLFPVTAYLIANRESLESKDLSQILGCLSARFVANELKQSKHNVPLIAGKVSRRQQCLEPACSDWQTKEIKLALPDGHQQKPTSDFLKRAGLNLQGYSGEAMNPRPVWNSGWLGIKVIRPQDMPLQVANGNFDLAITGEDWLREQFYRFPSMPVTKLLDFGFGKVKIVAAVTRDMPVADIDELKSLVQSGEFAHLRVASEYINISDKYLRDNHINPYKLIPTWGASEAFLPDDADILIDNTQTGKTLEQHNLKIIDVLFQSTACLIGNKDSLDSPAKKEKMEFLIQMLRAGLLTTDS